LCRSIRIKAGEAEAPITQYRRWIASASRLRWLCAKLRFVAQ
jgi:hypothetical protein